MALVGQLEDPALALVLGRGSTGLTGAVGDGTAGSVRPQPVNDRAGPTAAKQSFVTWSKLLRSTRNRGTWHHAPNNCHLYTLDLCARLRRAQRTTRRRSVSGRHCESVAAASTWPTTGHSF